MRLALLSPVTYGDAWTDHIFRLWNMKEAGCHFLLNDLTPDEWRGLIAMRTELSKPKKSESAKGFK